VLGFAAWTIATACRHRPVVAVPRRRPTPAPAAPGTPPATPSAPAERKGVLASVRQSGVLRVGMEPDAPPMRFINDESRTTASISGSRGLIADGLGAKRVQVVEADYEDLPDRLRAGDIDLIMGGYVPDPSVEGAVWSNGYLDFGLCLIVSEGMASTYRSVKDLAGSASPSTTIRLPSGGLQQNIPNARISKFSGDNGCSRRSNATRPMR